MTLMALYRAQRNQWNCEVQIMASLSFGPEHNHMNQASSLLFLDVLELLTGHLGEQLFIYVI